MRQFRPLPLAAAAALMLALAACEPGAGPGPAGAPAGPLAAGAPDKAVCPFPNEVRDPFIAARIRDNDLAGLTAYFQANDVLGTQARTYKAAASLIGGEPWPGTRAEFARQEACWKRYL